jgi:AraC-like DNA-binding protein
MRIEHSKLWQARHVQGLELLSARFFHHEFPRHTHGYFVIGINEAGNHGNFYRGGTQHIAPESIVLINPGEVHTGFTEGNETWCYRAFYPSVELVQTLAKELIGQTAAVPYFAEPIIYDADLFTMMLNAHRALEAAEDAMDCQVQWRTAISELIWRYLGRQSSPIPTGNEHRAVKAAKDFIDSCCTGEITLRQLSEVAQLSEFHLIRVFQRYVGVPPHKYLTQVRVEKAKKLLASGHSIADVALATGFADQSHFTRRFKGLMGITPGQYRH